jgi:uncharacterized protein (DUF885 family)
VEKVLKQMNGMIAGAPEQHPLYVTFKEKLDKIPAADGCRYAHAVAGAVAAAVKDQVYPAYRGLISYFTALRRRPKRTMAPGACRMATHTMHGLCACTPPPT